MSPDDIKKIKQMGQMFQKNVDDLINMMPKELRDITIETQSKIKEAFKTGDLNSINNHIEKLKSEQLKYTDKNESKGSSN